MRSASRLARRQLCAAEQPEQQLAAAGDREDGYHPIWWCICRVQRGCCHGHPAAGYDDGFTCSTVISRPVLHEEILEAVASNSAPRSPPAVATWHPGGGARGLPCRVLRLPASRCACGRLDRGRCCTYPLARPLRTRRGAEWAGTLRLHHRLFDHGAITVRETLRVQVARALAGRSARELFKGLLRCMSVSRRGYRV